MKTKLFLLVLFAGITACACGPASSDPLDGTSWELVAISKHPPLGGSHVRISFADGRVSGSGGCNSYGGEYQANGERIAIGKLASTLMACADPAMMEQETSFMQFLGEAGRFESAGGQLLLYWSGHEALTFVPAR